MRKASGAEDETRYSCDKVQTGMTQDDVLNVLGFPSDRNQNLLLIRGEVLIQEDLLIRENY